MALKKTLQEKIETDVKSRNLPQKVQKTNLKQRNIRMSDNDWILLRNHFQRKCLSISAGLRMIAKDYMEQQGLL